MAVVGQTPQFIDVVGMQLHPLPLDWHRPAGTGGVSMVAQPQTAATLPVGTWLRARYVHACVKQAVHNLGAAQLIQRLRTWRADTDEAATTAW